jgi:hypothetical protein
VSRIIISELDCSGRGISRRQVELHSAELTETGHNRLSQVGAFVRLLNRVDEDRADLGLHGPPMPGGPDADQLLRRPSAWQRISAVQGSSSAGLVASCDGIVIRLTPCDTVWTPPGEEHWHGAGVDCMTSHLAMLEGTEDGDGTTRLEPVTDQQYTAANQT